MAYSRNKISPEEDYALRIIAYFDLVSAVKDGEERYALAIAKETFLNPILEHDGSNYQQAKKQAYKQTEEKDKNYDVGAVADAIIKLQQREAVKTGVYGALGVIAVPTNKNVEKIIKSIDEDESNIPASTNMEV